MNTLVSWLLRMIGQPRPIRQQLIQRPAPSGSYVEPVDPWRNTAETQILLFRINPDDPIYSSHVL